MKDKILKYALQNAIKFDGKANPGAIIGKLIADDPSIRANMRDISPAVNEVLKEISSLSVEEMRAKLSSIAPELLDEKKEHKKKTLPDLQGASAGNVIMRFEPSPSGPMHIGHAYVWSLNYLLCKKYSGKLILRIGDTNPENIHEPAYDMLEDNARWLSKNYVSQIIVQSSRMEIYYSYMEKLLEMDKAYVCTCDTEAFRKLNWAGEPCPCRELGVAEQKLRWAKMFSDYKQGEAVVRAKTDLSVKNPAMRDFPLFRINESPHPKVGSKYRVWPLMNMAVTVDDIEMGITHVIRAKDHVDNAKRQAILQDYLNKKPPVALFVGRINFDGLEVSATKTREKISNGEYSSWEDIRLPFIDALRKRGFQPETFHRYAEDVGISLTDKTVSKNDFFKTIDAFNKDVVDASSDRYFFVSNLEKIRVDNAPELKVVLDLHPNTKKGGREFNTTNEFYISKDDTPRIKTGDVFRLMDCINIAKRGDNYVFESEDYEDFKKKGRVIIHWLPVSEKLVDVDVLMPDNTIVTGKAEKGVKNLKVGDIIQFERIGFVRLDKIENEKMTFWFGHR